MKKSLFIAAVLLCAHQALAKSVMCLKTQSGQYIEVVRVSMMVVPDGGNTFEIVVKDGEGATNVESISFEKHESDIDLTKYSGGSSSGDDIDWSKPVFLLTNTGKYFYLKDLPTMTAKDGSSQFDVTVGNTTESNVSYVYFYRGAADTLGDIVSGIDTPKEVSADESLRLLTPISSQMTISGCGAATEALVFSADGRQVAQSAVSNGVTTILVGHLTHGIYIVKVGKKKLKFMKR